MRSRYLASNCSVGDDSVGMRVHKEFSGKLTQYNYTLSASPLVGISTYQRGNTQFFGLCYPKDTNNKMFLGPAQHDNEPEIRIWDIHRKDHGFVIAGLNLHIGHIPMLII